LRTGPRYEGPERGGLGSSVAKGPNELERVEADPVKF
jgi:hypothetical protein